MRAKFAFSIAVLTLLALAPRPAAATAITYDFSGTLGHGPASDPSNTSVTGQFTIDFDTQSITAFHFLTPVTEIDASQWTPSLTAYTPATLPADNFVRLSFAAGPISTLTLLFQTTLASFDESTFYPHFIVVPPSTAVGSTLVCQESGFTSCVGFFGAPFVSGAATVHADPPPTVPEPASLTLLGGGLASLIAARRRRLFRGFGVRAVSRATVTLAMLALFALAPRPAAASAITYDFSGTLTYGPFNDPANKSITGQFTIDFDSQTITAFDFLTPIGEVASAAWHPALGEFVASDPADTFVRLGFISPIGSLNLIFRTTLAAFDGSTFYTGGIKSPGSSTASGLTCDDCATFLASSFVSGAATPRTPPPVDPPPPTVPEPASLTLLGGGLVAIAGRLRARGRRLRQL